MTTIVLLVLLVIESIFFAMYALSPKSTEQKLEPIETDVDVYENLKNVGYTQALTLEDNDYYIYTYKVGCPYCYLAENHILEFAEKANLYVMNIEQSIIDSYNDDPNIDFKQNKQPDPSDHIIMSVPVLYHIVDNKIQNHYYDYEEINSFVEGYFAGLEK